MNSDSILLDNEPVMDSIYGIIKINSFEKRLIATREMQRLRGIKQLGFVYLVFPNAEHSRFSHSLGVCNYSKVLVDQANTNIINNKRYNDWRNSFIKENALVKEVNLITEIERFVISAAGLLHDLPHSPFSHEIESSDCNSGIPIHDDYQNNSVFFNYLFNKEKSDIAKIIDIYNKTFWKFVKTDEKWYPQLKNLKKIKDGYVLVTEKNEDVNDINEPILCDPKSIKLISNKLPLLGVMIFEILLFDRTDMWAKFEKKNKEVLKNEVGVEVNIDSDGNKVTWRPIWNWFRPYRKDIIANTICADLIDYLLRDGKNTGIVAALDLKFLDRMTIVKSLPDSERPTELVVPSRKEIPDFCEHVVFDIYDHKRGSIRHSVITEIISFLQQRYLLAERVYNHRVVEGARSMLHEVAKLLTSTDSLDISLLHNFEENGTVCQPIKDESFFAWVLNLKEDSKDIVKAKNLVRMIQDRRVYREAVIIDGIYGFTGGSLAGAEINCNAIADVLLDDENRKILIKKLSATINKDEVYKNDDYVDKPHDDTQQLVTISVRKYGKRYKIPRVLVLQSLSNDSGSNEIEIQPLFVCEYPKAIKSRLDSMKLAYDSLWKVYLFVHPYFHQKKFINLHKDIEQEFMDFVNKDSKVNWINSIQEFSELIPNKALDIKTYIENELPLRDESFLEMKFIDQIILVVNRETQKNKGTIQLTENDNAQISRKLKELDLMSKLKDEDIQLDVLKKIKKLRLDWAKAARDNTDTLISYVTKVIMDIINDIKLDI